MRGKHAIPNDAKSTSEKGPALSHMVGCVGDVEIYTISTEAQRDVLVNVMHAGRGEWGPRNHCERVR